MRRQVKKGKIKLSDNKLTPFQKKSNKLLEKKLENLTLEDTQTLLRLGFDVDEIFQNAKGAEFKAVIYLVEQGVDCSFLSKENQKLLFEKLYESKEYGAAKKMVEGGFDINAEYDVYPKNDYLNKESKEKYTGQTLLHIAAEKGDYELVKYLLDLGADIETKNKFGDTALSIAAYYGFVDIVRELSYKKADVNISNIHGYTPLHLSALRGYKEIVDFLLWKGALIDKEDNYGNSALKFALGHKNFKMACFLIDRRANIDCIKELSQTEQFYLVNNIFSMKYCDAFTSVLEAVLKSGFDINTIRKGTLLQFFSTRDNSFPVKFLLEHGANPDIKGEFRFTPIKLAFKNGKYYIATILAEKGANLSELSCDEQSFLVEQFCLINFSIRQNFDKAAKIIDNIENINYFKKNNDEYDRSSLYKYEPIIEEGDGLFKLFNPKQFEREKEGICLLFKPEQIPQMLFLHCALRGEHEIADRLLRLGVGINATFDSQYLNLCFKSQKQENFYVKASALHIAVDQMNIESIKFLIKEKIDLNMLDENGFSALEVSRILGLWEVSKLLIDSGANTEIGEHKVEMLAVDFHGGFE